MVDTTEIPRERWMSFLDTFSTAHEGWIVDVEVIGPEIGDQEEADRLPLVGIGADVKDGESRIEISLGGRPDGHLTRIIDRAKRVWVRASEMQVHEALAVESEDGTMTVVHFRHLGSGVETERPPPGR
jgi:hypothetical protein